MPPKQPPDNDVVQLLQRLSSAQKVIEQEDSRFLHKVERLDKAIRLVVWAIGGIIGLAVWMTTIHAKVASLDMELEKRELVVERVNELWFMKEHGISFAEAYTLKHGKPPSVK